MEWRREREHYRREHMKLGYARSVLVVHNIAHQARRRGTF